MSCIKVEVSRISEHLQVDARCVNQHLNISVFGNEKMRCSVTKVCDVAIINWKALYSADGFALYDVNGVQLMAK